MRLGFFAARSVLQLAITQLQNIVVVGRVDVVAVVVAPFACCGFRNCRSIECVCVSFFSWLILLARCTRFCIDMHVNLFRIILPRTWGTWCDHCGVCVWCWKDPTIVNCRYLMLGWNNVLSYFVFYFFNWVYISKQSYRTTLIRTESDDCTQFDGDLKIRNILCSNLMRYTLDIQHSFVFDSDMLGRCVQGKLSLAQWKKNTHSRTT